MRTTYSLLAALALSYFVALRCVAEALAADAAVRRSSLELAVKTSAVVTLEGKVPRMQVNNPEVLDLTPLSPNQVQISAKKPGVAQVNLWDELDKVHSVDVVAYADGPDLAAQRAAAPAARAAAAQTLRGQSANAALVGEVRLSPDDDGLDGGGRAGVSDSPVLYLYNGDQLPGTPSDGDGPQTIGWQSPAFTAPFRFDLGGVMEIVFPSERRRAAWADDDYRFELAGGDVLLGKLAGLSDTHWEIESSVAGRVRLKRSAVRSLDRCGGNTSLVYSGPNVLAEWRATPEREQWIEDAGALEAKRESISLWGDFELPPQAMIEVELSWKFSPEFALTIAAGRDADSARHGYRLVTVDRQLVIVRETADDLDLALVMELPTDQGPNRVHLLIFVDQQRERADVFSDAGAHLATIHAASGQPPLPGIFIEHKRGRLRLERLRITKASGAAPEPMAAGTPHVRRVDGRAMSGKLAGYDAAARRFALATDQGPQSFNADEIDHIYLGETPERTEKPTAKAVCRDGTRLAGWFEGMDGERLKLRSSDLEVAAAGPLELPVGELTRVEFAAASAEMAPNSAMSVLRLRGGRIHGRLMPGRATEDQSALCWRPAASSTAVPLVRDASARIILGQALHPISNRQQAVPEKIVGGNAVQPLGGQMQQPIGKRGAARAVQPPPGMAAAPKAKNTAPLPARAAPTDGDLMHLRVGDTFECRVTGIDAKGIEFHTADLVPRRVDHDRVKAVEFGVLYRRSALADTKWQRLLTLPRMRKNDPPTHILAGVNNDFLRGRLVALSEDSVRFVVGDSERNIPRERIAAIIWLQPEADAADEPANVARSDESPDTDAKTADAAEVPIDIGPADRGDVQAISTNGMSLTFAAEKVDDDSISGTSTVLGPCQLPLREVAELLLGDRRREWSAQLGYHRWNLADAVVPRAFLPDEEGKQGSGLDSALVGQPAPDFELALAEGGKFRLADERGHVVVLDFWATWCAPCIAGLPRVARTVGEFEHAKLVTVNLQQTAAESTAALNRLELELAVALDSNGRVAAQYGATAIPYTVVIGPDGLVARVFIGTTPQIEEELRAAIKELENNQFP